MSVKKVLVIRFSSLGDIVLLTPVFRLIKKIHPEAQIDFLTSTSFSSVCANNPHINQIIALDRGAGSEDVKRIKKIIKSATYDLVLDAHRSLRSRAILMSVFGPAYFMSPRIHRIDKRSLKRNLLLLTKKNFLQNAMSQREAYCQLIAPLKEITPDDLKTEVFPGESEKYKIKEIIREYELAETPNIIIGPSASFSGKCWPKTSFLELARCLADAKIRVILVGGKSDDEPLWMEDQGNGKFLNLAGDLSFLETAELARYCKIAICNDSAVGHFAEAVGTPAISIFGPTVREFGYAPFLPESKVMEVDLPCRPCSRNGKGKCKNKIDRQCLIDIKVNDVLNAALQILKQHGN